MASAPIRQQTVVAQVMDQIRNLIASGAYTPGDRIPTEKELAERFGIGRSSVREAIKIFNYLGILESKAALGTFVQDRSNISSEALTWSLLLGGDELEDIIDFRGSIELWCLMLLKDALNEKSPAAADTMRELQSIIDDMGKAASAGDREALKSDDYQFHLTIIRSAGNPLFLSIYETLRSFLTDEIEKSQNDYEDPQQIFREHDHILRVIREGDKMETLAIYRGHITNIKKRVKRPSRRSGT